MNSYTAYFYTDAEYASTGIEAATPEEALALARERLNKYSAAGGAPRWNTRPASTRRHSASCNSSSASGRSTA